MGRKRTVVWFVLAVACTAGAVLALADVQTPARLLLTPLFMLVVPGLATVGLLRDRNPLAMFAVGMAASLAANVVLAEAMLLLDAWSPRAGVATIGIVGLFLFVLRLLYRRHEPAPQGTGPG